jgi:hypothetical protein
MSDPANLFLATKNTKSSMPGIVNIPCAYRRLAGFICSLLFVFFVAKPALVDRV